MSVTQTVLSFKYGLNIIPQTLKVVQETSVKYELHYLSWSNASLLSNDHEYKEKISRNRRSNFLLYEFLAQ
jgi:hypothetical protein